MKDLFLKAVSRIIMQGSTTVAVNSNQNMEALVGHAQNLEPNNLSINSTVQNILNSMHGPNNQITYQQFESFVIGDEDNQHEQDNP